MKKQQVLDGDIAGVQFTFAPSCNMDDHQVGSITLHEQRLAASIRSEPNCDSNEISVADFSECDSLVTKVCDKNIDVKAMPESNPNVLIEESHIDSTASSSLSILPT
ncbi:unnamed protein product [Orchesella dallaii]|uniref:Uncharacterized protein n=1 Tax=Orchesella dallaii TaxID=48710 RepID=A0ABP1S0E5_9HEXA